MQSHSIVEDAILLACKEIVKSKVTTPRRKYLWFHCQTTLFFPRIDDMSSDVRCHVHANPIDGRVFLLQFDESTYISKKCQLLSYKVISYLLMGILKFLVNNSNL